MKTFRSLVLMVSSLAFAVSCGAGQDGARPAPSHDGAGQTAGSTGGGGASATQGGAPTTAGAGSPSASAGTAGSTGTAGTAGAAGLEPTVPQDGFVAADDPRLQFYGRWLTNDPKRPVASWGPVVVKLRFEGPSLSVLLEDEGADLGEEGRGNVYQFSIDGADFQLLGPGQGSSFELGSSLSTGEHDVTLVRRTESKWGKSTFVGFQLASGARVLDAGPRPARSVEVFGDSISAGLANENSGYYTNQTENGYLAFGPVLARQLDAEWRVEARGGGSFFNDFYLPMLPFFGRTFGPPNKQHAPTPDNPEWDFSQWQPDVLIVALGTNDFSEQYPHIEQSLYVAKHQAFLTTLRDHYPSSEIFCLAPLKAGAPWDEARSYIQTSVATFGDPHIHALDPTTSEPWLSYPGDYVAGDEFHPNLMGHEKIATRLSAIVKDALGW